MSNNILDLIFNVKTKNNSLPKIEKGLEQVAEKTEKTTKKMTSDFSNAFKTIAAGFSVKMLADQVLGHEKIALGLDIIKVKNEELAKAMNQTSAASFGLTNKFEMVDAVNKAMAFGIDLSNGRYEKLVKTATKIAAVMGTDVKSAFNDIIVASGRQSRMIADNMGVIISATDANDKYAAQLGKTAAQLTDNEKKTAFLNEMMLQMEKTTEDVTDSMMENHLKMNKSLALYKKTFTEIIDVVTRAANSTASFFESVGESAADFFGKTSNNMSKQISEGLRFNKLMELEKEKIRVNEAARHEVAMITGQEFIDQSDELLESWVQRNLLIKEHTALMMKDKKAVDDWMNQGKLGLEDDDSFNVFGSLDSAQGARDDARATKAATKRKAASKKTLADRKKALDAMFGLQTKQEDLNKKSLERIERDNAMAAIERLQDLEAYNTEQATKKQNAIDSELDAERMLFLQKKQLRDEQARDEQAALEESQAMKEKYFGVAESLGRGLFTAILSDQENAVALYLANQAIMYGQDLIWDGAKTILKGSSMNAVVPGSGVKAIQSGTQEVVFGTALLAGGLVGQSALSSSSNQSGASERASQQQEQQTINMNVSASLYGSKKEAKKEIKGLL